MHGHAAFALGVDILSQRGEEAGDVGRAARAPKPRLAVVIPQAGKGVLVEEPLAIERDAADHAVIERPLHHVGIARIAVELQHAMRPEDESDCRACLGIGSLIGQVIVESEAFVGARRTDAARQVHPPQRYILPKALARGQELGITRLARQIRHGAIEVHRAHGVAHHLDLLAHRQVRLAVVVVAGAIARGVLAPGFRLLIEVVGLPPALIHEVAGQLQVAALARGVVELYER